MDLAYLHIVLNHLPIMGVPIEGGEKEESGMGRDRRAVLINKFGASG
ncbi:MAG: hypothetical protein KBF83_06775 [Pyrinomonadaceae bacterium]|nr:hypothetical protein [Pyrinomonadaceae bacterium]